MSKYFTSVLLALCLALQAGSQAAAFTPPDPETYGARLEAGDVAKAREWLDAGVPVDFVADRIGTGLMIGAWLGELEMMKLFLARGADVNKANAIGEQALMHAAWRGNLAAVDLLLASGARPDSAAMNWSALHYAAFAGHKDIVARLLARGADINARSTNGSSALMMAVYEGHESLVKDLLARGADRTVKNDRGDGALEWAFKFQRLGIARMVAAKEQFAAAANRPAAAWGAPVRSVAAPVTAAPAVPATAAPAVPAQTPDEAAERIRELENVRAALAERGMTEAVQKLDRRISAMRAQRARADMDVPAGALLEISASRAQPEDQTTRLVIDANAPPP